MSNLLKARRKAQTAPVCLSISRHEHENDGSMSEIQAVKRLQTIAYSSFNARRNAGRVERYFVNVQSRRYTMVVYVVGFILIMATMFLCYYEMREDVMKAFDQIVISMTRATVTNRFYRITSTILQTGYFSQLLAGLLDDPPMFPLTMDGAAQVSQLFVAAHKTPNEAVVYGIGVPNRIIIVENLDNTIRFCMANNGPIYMWDTQNGFSSSFPDISGGTKLNDEVYDVTKRLWYQLALTLKRSAWTEPFMASKTLNSAPMVSCVTPLKNPGEYESAVVMAGILLDDLHDTLLRYIPSSRSRFALVNDDGEVLAITGNATAIEYYKGDIVTKTISEAMDPLWMAATSSSAWNSDENFTFKATLNGESAQYIVNKIPFETVEGSVWTFYSIMCADDLLQTDWEVTWTNLYIIFSVFIGMAIALFVTLSCMDRAVQERQSRILSGKQGGVKRHVKSMGIMKAKTMLTKLIQSHGDNQYVVSHIHPILWSLSVGGANAYFNKNEFYSDIEDERVSNKFQEIYGRVRNVKVESIPEFNITKHKKHNRHESLSTSATNTGFAIDPANQMIFLKRHNILVMDSNNVVDAINEILLDYNKIFDVGGFGDFIMQHVNDIPPEFRMLVLDSVDFANILLIWRVNQLLISDKIALALMFAIIAWHKSMKQNRSTATRLIDRYFQMDLRQMQNTTRELLLDLHRYIGETEADQWAEWEQIVMDIIEAAPLVQQYQVMSKVQLFSECVIFDNSEKCDWFRSMEICKLVFIASTESFVFHAPDMSRRSYSIVNRDFETREPQINQFMGCLFNEYMQPLMECLGELCEKGFIKKFCENVDVTVDLSQLAVTPRKDSGRKRSDK